MWQGLDFSKLNITFHIGNTEFRLVEAKRTLFYENFPNHMHSFFEFHYVCGGEGILVLPEEMQQLQCFAEHRCRWEKWQNWLDMIIRFILQNSLRSCFPVRRWAIGKESKRSKSTYMKLL